MSGHHAGDGRAKAAPNDPTAPSSEDEHEKDTVVPPYDVESYARMATEFPPVPVTRSVSVMVSRATLMSEPPRPSEAPRSISIPPPPTVRRPDLGNKGILDDPSAMARVPFRVVSGERLQNSMLDHREGFILSLIDGQLDIEAICDVSGMSADEVLEILESFRLSGVIQLG